MCSNSKSKEGTKAPRQPWHDLHCKVEGPAAYDILTNFEQRWKKATKWSEIGHKFKKVTRWHDDSLIKLERISWILSPSPAILPNDSSLWVSNDEDKENWHVQVITIPFLMDLAEKMCMSFKIMCSLVEDLDF